ncbi:tyrosine-type recombinase/integrase [Acidiphilium sp.]|uniref:tyrosine-type recombinase/integrase n=1 Tax=Acidiphilium sp. TaxID=527 RepID=UPI00258BBD2A|nr:tyrosine-type recombinase/integrase [Acidiphilium sp.]
MLEFQVRRFQTRSGPEVAVLLDRGKGPVFWPNVYITSEYRKRQASVNTCVRVLRSLGMARMWAASLGRDLDEDLRSGAFLSMNDAEALADFLSLSAADQSVRATTARAPAQEHSKVVCLEDVRPNHRKLAGAKEKAADPVESAARIRWTASYVEWHLTHRLGDLDRRRQDTTDLSELGKAVVARLRQRVPRAEGTKDNDASLEGVAPEVLGRIEEALLPGAPGNPFKSSFVQARNYLIWRLLLDPGARRDEVRQAKAKHVEYPIRRFHITVSKTRARSVAISATTAEAFDCFMMQHWAMLPQAARRRGYLFTDESGRHLSLRAFNRIFERIREKVPGVPDFMAPHTVRRSWNDAYSARIDALPPERRPSEKREVEMRNRLQGWTEQSSMGARYAKRHIQRAADKLGEELADRLIAPNQEKKNS